MAPCAHFVKKWRSELLGVNIYSKVSVPILCSATRSLVQCCAKAAMHLHCKELLQCIVTSWWYVSSLVHRWCRHVRWLARYTKQQHSNVLESTASVAIDAVVVTSASLEQ